MFEWVRASDGGESVSPAPLLELLDLNKDLFRRDLTVPAGQEVLDHKSRSDAVFVVKDGWIAAHRMLPSGTRQIIDFKLPTDLVHLQSQFQTGVYSGFETLTDVCLIEFSMAEILELGREDKNVSVAIMQEFARDDAIRTEHLVSLARRSASDRTAHLMLELCERLQRAGLATRAKICGLPSQTSIADALGLTTVHLSRVLTQLRKDGLLNFQRGSVEFLDWAGLAQSVGFERDYLV